MRKQSLAQAEQRERRGREHDVGALGEAINRRNRIEREQDVRAADDDHYQQHRRHHPATVDAGKQLVAVVFIAGLEQLLGDT